MTVTVRNNLRKLNDQLKKAREQALSRGGAYLEGAIKYTITEGRGEWPELLPKTIARKGSSHPLIDTGKLRASITHKLDGDTAVHVGVFGEEAVIAATHEFGSFAKNIPERSYLRSTFNEKKKDVEKVMAAEYEKACKESVL